MPLGKMISIISITSITLITPIALKTSKTAVSIIRYCRLILIYSEPVGLISVGIPGSSSGILPRGFPLGFGLRDFTTSLNLRVSASGACLYDVFRHIRIFLEILVELLSQFFGCLYILVLIGPCIYGVKHFIGHSGA